MLRRPTSIAIILLLFVSSASVAWMPTVAATAGRDDLDFSGGPTTDQVISGTYTVRATNVADMDYILVDVHDGTAWSSVANITAAPWLTAWDTSAQADGTSYKLRLTGTLTNGTELTAVESNTFTLDNTAPSSLTFEVSDAIVGDGSSTINRAWFTTAATGMLEFNWSATDAHLSHATLTNVPGPGTPAQDGPGLILNQWQWSSGAFTEGTWTALLSVFDEGGLSTQSTLYIGIDRTGPSVGTPTLSVTENVWTDESTLVFSGLGSGASDGSGSGIASYEVRDSADDWSNIGAGGSGSIPLTEGVRTIQFRAIDNVGNAGDALNVTIKADRTTPVLGGWDVPTLTDTHTGVLPISVEASDAHSGIDESTTVIQYGFDDDGAGETPDITTTWLNLPAGTDANLPASIVWSARADEYLSLRAVLTDEAGNTVTTSASHFLVRPGLDFSWESAQLDRLVVRAGTEGEVAMNATLVSNMPYAGTVTVKLESAPADRDAETAWTTLETTLVPIGGLSDTTHDVDIGFSILAAGEYDLRLVIDPNDVIAEFDEGNNEDFSLITAAQPSIIGAVPGFAPAWSALMLVGFALSGILRRD